MLKRALAAALALPLVAGTSSPAAAENWRITCRDFQGSRVQYAANPISPRDQLNRVIKLDDAITGLRLEIAFNTAQPQAVVTSYGNINTGGAAQSFETVRVVSKDMISFVGIDPHDGSLNLLSFYPKAAKLMWTIHSDRIAFVDNVVLAKTFIASCEVAVQR